MRARLFTSLCLTAALSTPASLGRAANDTQQQPSNSQLNDNGTLSEKLDKQKGVLKPEPGVNDPIVKPAPAPNPDKMPVIPPPKAPGTEAK